MTKQPERNMNYSNILFRFMFVQCLLVIENIETKVNVYIFRILLMKNTVLLFCSLLSILIFCPNTLLLIHVSHLPQGCVCCVQTATIHSWPSLGHALVMCSSLTSPTQKNRHRTSWPTTHLLVVLVGWGMLHSLQFLETGF